MHKRIQDVLGSGQIFWNNGLAHSCMHPASLCIPLSPFQAHMHSRHRQRNSDLLTRSLKVLLFPRSSLCWAVFIDLKFGIYLNVYRVRFFFFLNADLREKGSFLPF